MINIFSSEISNEDQQHDLTGHEAYSWIKYPLDKYKLIQKLIEIPYSQQGQNLKCAIF